MRSIRKRHAVTIPGPRELTAAELAAATGGHDTATASGDVRLKRGYILQN